MLNNKALKKSSLVQLRLSLQNVMQLHLGSRLIKGLKTWLVLLLTFELYNNIFY